MYLQPSDVGADDKFIDMGLDSILGVEWVSIIEKQYGIPLSATKVYDYSTIHKLAQFLAIELTKKEEGLTNRTLQILRDQ